MGSRARWVTAGLGVLVLAGIGIVLYQRASAPKPAPPVTPVAKEELPAEVSLPGTIRAQSVVDVPAPFEGTVEAFFAAVGEDVFEGQVLARIASTGLEAESQALRRAVELAQERVNSLEGSVIQGRLEASRARAEASRAKSDFDRAERDYRRQELLFREGATPKLVYEKAQREFELAQTEFRSIDEVAQRADDRVSRVVQDLDAAKQTLLERNQAMDNIAAHLGAGEVVCPVEGMVQARRGNVGEHIPADIPDLFQIATDLLHLDVEVQPPPPVLARLRPGQHAFVIIAAAGDGILAEVRTVNEKGTLISFNSPTPTIKPGMTAQVRIKLDTETPAPPKAP